MGFVRDLTGRTAADAALKSADIQAAGVQEGIGEVRGAEGRAQGFLDPFQQVGQQGLDQAGFLTDPTAQFDFLQQNPLFQAALDKSTTETQQAAAARGRISAGDTLQQLSQNVLLAASPLITEQKRSITDLLNMGVGVAGGQANIATGAGGDIANLITSGAASEAAGVVGAAQARGQGARNILTGGLLAGSLLTPRPPAAAAA